MSLYEKLSTIAASSIRKRYNPDDRASVLYFHRVLEKKDKFYPDDITIKELDRLISQLVRFFNIVPLSEIKRNKSENGKLNIGLSFDDGYRDSLHNALPVLRKHNVPATVFVATRALEQGILFQDKVVEIIRSASSSSLSSQKFAYQGRQSERVLIAQELVQQIKYYPLKKRNEAIENLLDMFDFDEKDFPRIMLSEDELLELSKDVLIDIGAHTHDHTILTTLSEGQAEYQINQSKSVLEELLGQKISLFCYPNGNPQEDFNQLHVQQVLRAGFEMAFTTHDGGIGPDTSILEIPRFLPYRKQPLLRALSAIKVAGE